MKSDMIWINEGFVLDDTKTDTRSPRPYLCGALFTQSKPIWNGRQKFFWCS